MESFEDVDAALVPDSQSPEAVEPGKRAFHHPAMSSQTLAALDAAPGNARLDRTPAQRRSAMREVVALVGMELGRSPLRSADAMADRRHGIDQRFEEAAVVDVGRAEPDGERNTPGVGDQMALRACSAAVSRVGAGLPAP